MTTISGFFCFLLFISVFELSGNESPGKMTGQIVCVETNSPVKFANIGLIDIDEKIVAGSISDDSGKFEFQGISYGMYKLVITYLGYETHEKEIIINDESNDLKLGTINLKTNAELLSEVVISAERLKGEQAVDRTVFNINEQIQKASSGAMDVLRRIPGITVDFQENVSVEGSSKIIFMVNGIRRSKNFVAQLHPEDFNRVEIITNPGVQFDADVDAVINIVTKQNITGIRGNISLQLSNPESYYGNQFASLDYGTNKYRVFVSNRTYIENFPTIELNEILFQNKENDTVRIVEEATGKALWFSNSTNYGLDFFINDNNVFNIYGDYNYSGSRNADFLMQSTEFTNGEISSNYNMNKENKNTNYRFFHSIFYKHNNDNKEQEFTTQLNHYHLNSQTRNNYQYLNDHLGLIPGDFSENERYETIENHRQSLELRNDYRILLGQQRLSLGTQSFYQWFDNDFENSSNLSRNFVYNEFRQDAYINISSSINKFRYSTGIRLTHSESEINDEVSYKYSELLPQASLQYVLNDNSSLRLSARRQIIRPSMNQLNPFSTTYNDITVFAGNPELKPQIVYRNELQYAINVKSSYLSPRVYLNYSNNSIQQSFTQNDDGVSLFRPENIGKHLEYGIAFSGVISLKDRLRFNPYISAYQTSIEGDDNYKDELAGYQISSSIEVYPFNNRKIAVAAAVQYQSPQLGYKSIISQDMLVFIAVTANINDNLFAFVQINPFINGHTTNKTESTDNSYKYFSKKTIDSSMLISFSVSYRFSRGIEPRSLKRSVQLENDGGKGIL